MVWVGHFRGFKNDSMRVWWYIEVGRSILMWFFVAFGEGKS